MSRITLAVVVSTVLASCATGTAPRKPEPIPPELVPAGYTAEECHITEPGGPITQTGADGRPVTVGDRPPKVECTHRRESITTKSTPTCATKSGKELPLSDCCMNPDGTKIAGCTIPYIYEPGDLMH